VTVEEYEILDVDHPTELVRGEVIHFPFGTARRVGKFFE
jgi:hypothetical protein